jgi:hypothetical protein
MDVGQGRKPASSATVEPLAGSDTGNQIWATDGFKLQEVGQDIRDDISQIDQTLATMCFMESSFLSLAGTQ